MIFDVSVILPATDRDRRAVTSSRGSRPGIAELGTAGGPPTCTRSWRRCRPGNAPHYARIVRERAVRRRLLLAGRRVIQLASSADGESHGLTERALRELKTSVTAAWATA